MAKTPFNSVVDTGAGQFTVPAGKHAVFNASCHNGSMTLTVNGAYAFGVSTGTPWSGGPLVATSGQVVKTAAGAGFISGFVYDN